MRLPFFISIGANMQTGKRSHNGTPMQEVVFNRKIKPEKSIYRQATL
jgi:hypothetical protein